jgi:dynein assembly factor with WDR repeat domains 1
LKVTFLPLLTHAELIEKQLENQDQKFGLFRELRAHLLPLTNCAFNKSGDK